ncbi:MAG: hypothetical protein JO027_12195 [Solirubrobacterales bacterium]|nr:hypothetical protein [Solirubrobacterales bacterium]
MATATGTTHTGRARRAETLRLPRTTGAVSGLLILLLGIWAGIVPFIGGYFHYAFANDQTWHYTAQRLWLDIVPGAVAVIGGFMLMTASSRIGGLTAGWVALAAGAWFVVGPTVSLLWHHTIYAIGAPTGGHTRQMLEWIGFFYGVGALIIGLAAFAMGRYFSRPRLVEEPAVVAADAAAAEGAGRRGPVRHAAVADAPVEERAAVRDRPADREALAGEAVAADRPAERGALAEDRPAQRGAAVGDVPAERPGATERTIADPAPVSGARAADEPMTDRPTSTTGPATTGPATTTGPVTGTTSTRRRSGGLLGRFRRP